MSAPAAAPATTAPRPRGAIWLWLAWAVLTVYFVSPPREVFNQTLDPSNYASYAYFVTHHFQWGVDVMPMPGPFGFVLFGYCYSGELFGTRLVADLALCAGFTALLLNFLGRARRGLLRWIWLATMIIAVPMIDDLLLDATVLLSAVALLLEPPDRLTRWKLLASVFIAFIALIKGTHLMMSGLVFGAVALLAWSERSPRRLLQPLAAFVVAFVGFWLSAHQHLLNLPAHLETVRQLAAGYNETMGLDEEPMIFAVGVALLVGVALALAAAFWPVRRHASFAIAQLFLAGFAFLQWKHGFTRADGHVAIFFAAAAVLSLTTLYFTYGIGAADGDIASPTRAARVGLVSVVAATVVLGLLGAAQFSVKLVPLMLRDVPARLLSHADYLVQPAAFRAKLDHELATVRLNKDLPAVRAAVKQDRIDFFGNEEGVLLLNHLNYHPKPMGGGTFNVVNAWLERRNETFTLNPRTAPAWQLVKIDSIDERLPSADDGLVLRALIDCYAPVLMERDYLLLQRVRDRSPAVAPQPLGLARIQPGQAVAVPPVAPDQMVLFSLRAPLDAYGRWRNTVYRAPVLTGLLVTDAHPHGRRFVLKPALVEAPTLLSPLVEGTLDLLRVYGGAGDTVRSLTLDAAPGFDLAGFEIAFFAAPRPPKPAVDTEELLTYARASLYNREPVNMVTGNTGIKELDREPITLVHAPGSITWDLKPGDQLVSFEYGLMPQAYLNGGTTDGVEFNVEVLWPPKDGRVVWKQMLRPHTIAADQGMHRVRVYLPPYEPGAQLRIRTDPGPDKDGAYDQSYVTHVQIKSGDLVGEQFNGLGAVPASRQLPHEAIAGIGDHDVYLIHAPNQVRFDLPPHAHRFTGQIGLLPGAYTHGGHTDGVGFTLWLESPEGERRKVWYRYVDPTHHAVDQGELPISVELPSAPDGSHLVLETDIGPNGDRGWDQSFVEHVRFE